jgi:hypothetical protein
MIGAPGRIKGVRFGSDGAIGPAIPDCRNCPSAAGCAGRSGRSADRRDGLRHRRHRPYQRIIRRRRAAGDRGDDVFLGNNVADDIGDANDIGDERRVIGDERRDIDDNIGNKRRDIDNDVRNERRDIDLFGHFGEIHCRGERRRVGSSGAIIRSSLRQCTALGDVPAIWGFGDGTVLRRHQSFLRALRANSK